jgi:SAM-dependent methyltransferase
MDMSLEYTFCNLCGADQTRALFKGKDRLHSQPGEFNVVECQSCGLIYLNPRPVPRELSRYYPSDYRPYVAPVQAAQRRISRWDARYGLYKRLRAVAGMQPKGRLLDVGCATGDFLLFARERGWDVNGVELIDEAAGYCRDKLGLPVVTGDILEAAFEPDRFDVVTLWNVFEHLYDPKATLQEIQRVLRPDGLLVMAVPDVGSLDARLFGPAWAGYDVPRHLYTFSRETLDRMLSKAGFHVVRRRCLDSSHFIFFLSLQFWLRERSRWQWALRWIQSLEYSRWVRLLAAPYFRVIDWLVKGPVVTVFARQVQQK